MIDRLQLIRNIGQFDSVDSGASIPLSRLTVVYSENGRGKTTLASVLRSLASGDPLPISERRRFAATQPPLVVLACNDGQAPAIFQDNAWSRTLAEVVVFDDVFIHENVHSGLVVDAHHRQNLHGLILGSQALVLSLRVQELVEKIEIHNRELRTRQAAIPEAIRGRLSIDQFCALPDLPDIDQAIQEAERALESAKQEDEIRAKPSFELLNLPELDFAAVEDVLRRDLPDVEAVTLSRVEDHLARLGDDGEAWVADGMHWVSEGEDRPPLDVCPFCAQPMSGSTLLQHYRAYFSDEYASLKDAVKGAADTVRRVHGGGVSAGFERALRVAIERRQFWSQFCEVPAVDVDTAAIVRDWEAAREAVLAQLTQKLSAPLERVDVSSETRSLARAYDAHRQAVATLNQRLRNANEQIAVVKERASSADITVLAADVSRLRATERRHEPEIAQLCDDYLQEKLAKEETQQRRNQAQADLEEQRAQAFPGYEEAINRFLARFNAGFRLGSVSYANTRGGPTCTYSVLINNTAVPVGGRDPAPGESSFRNTLSAGDRNTLALAFFFASLQEDPGLASRIVVIDDPISSLDDHRTLSTIQEIKQLVRRAAQVIVLSHNRPFLCQLWQGTDPSIRAALEVVRDGTGSTLRAWDVAQDSVTEHDRRDVRLHEFLDRGTGEPREIAQMIRPHLEGYLRVALAGDFPPGTLLGPFLHVCRQRLGSERELLDERKISELDQIREYANRYHHDTNPAWETEAINSTELAGFVGRTLRFTRP